MSWSNERKITVYLDLIRQKFGSHTLEDALQHCYTLGLTATGATWSVYDRGTWNTGTASGAFETFFALASISVDYVSKTPDTTCATLTAVCGTTPFGSKVKN